MSDSDRPEPQEQKPESSGRIPDVSESEIAALGQLGEYRLLEKLGEGGMGVVYRALHVELERVVALKVVRADRVGDSQAVERFRREIKAAGKLEHPNIVLAHDARQIDGTHLLVMEFIEGLDLGQLLERMGPLPIADACEAARQAACGLHHAHEHGLIHRDVKPSNLMLSRTGAVKILDLGLARLQASPKTSQATTGVGFAIGTPDYMAPEQASDSRDVDARSDVYGLGCTLYALLAGEPPFSDPTHRQPYEKMMAHVHEQPAPLGDRRPEVPQSLNAIVMRMLAKKPDDRLANMSEVAEGLTEFTSGSDLAERLSEAVGRPVTTRISTAQTPRDSNRRRVRPVHIIASVVVAALAILLALLVWWPGHRLPPQLKPAGNSPVACAQPQRPEMPGWIVMSWTVRGIGRPDLWLFRPDGTQRVQITESPRHFDVHPCFSPDGRQVAFVRGRELEEATSLWVCRSNGEDAREVVVPETDGQRVMSPVWRSDTEILYTLDPYLDRMPDMELWQIDLESGNTHLIFPFRQTMVGGIGMATDISPAEDQLALVLQRRGFWPMANVYVADLDGSGVDVVSQDVPDECKDARALWSPDGERIAWHHNFTRGGLAEEYYYGVGLARRADDRWEPRFQPEPDGRMTPLAWSPDGYHLLCARMSDDETRATLVLIDDRFQPVVDLFETEVHSWQPGRQDLGRLADWAIVPDDLQVGTPR